MDDQFLDALVDAFSDDDEDEDETRRSSIITTGEKSMFYKSAVEDQTWLHTETGDEISDQEGCDTPADMSEATPTGLSQKDKKQLSLSALEREMHESYAKLPAAADMSSESQLSAGEIDSEMETLKKRLHELENEKERLRKGLERSPVVANAESPVVQKVRECPIDFTQQRGSLGIDAEGGSSIVERNCSDDEQNASAISARLLRKRKSEVERSGNSKVRRIGLATAEDAATAALREKAKEAGAKMDANGVASGGLAAYDGFFGIRVQAPKVSSITFQNYVGIRQKMRISEVRSDSSINWDDWVTMGVLVDKTPLKTSASGSQFSIWKLSDLIDCQRVVRLLLFGDSAKAVWKLNKGDVVAILNASKMENKPDGFPVEKTNVLTLKIDNKQKIVEIGYCPDYGICKGIRKQDNLHCSNFVNKSKSDYCDFHILNASKRLAARRGEFQLGSNVPPKKFNDPVKKVLPGGNLRTSRLPIKNGVATAVHSSQSSVVSLKAAPLIKVGSSCVSKSASAEVLAGAAKATDEPSSSTSAESAQFREALRANTVGSRHVLNQLAKNGKSVSTPNVKTAASQASLAIKPKLTCRQFLGGQKTVGSSQGSRLVKGEEAKAKAIAILRARGIAPKSELTSKAKESNAAADSSNEGAGNKIPFAKRPRLLGQISNLNKEQLKQLAGTKSSHDAELAPEDARRQDEYFKVMEAKEKVDQRATEVMSLKGCKVVTCRTCKYTWNSQSTLCKQNSHVVQWHTAEKRFFKCRTCSSRVVAYDKYPSKPCQCGSTTFVRVAMRQESKGPQLIGETLKVRGDEESFFN